MRQCIHNTHISYIDTCTLVIDIFLHWQQWSLGRWRTLFGTTKNVLCAAIRLCASPRHFLIWMRAVGQRRRADYRGVFLLNYALLRWMRQRIHNTLTVVVRYLRRMGNKTIPDSGDPRLDPPFVVGIDQSVVDSYSLDCLHIDTPYCKWVTGLFEKCVKTSHSYYEDDILKWRKDSMSFQASLVTTRRILSIYILPRIMLMSIVCIASRMKFSFTWV